MPLDELNSMIIEFEIVIITIKIHLHIHTTILSIQKQETQNNCQLNNTNL